MKHITKYFILLSFIMQVHASQPPASRMVIAEIELQYRKAEEIEQLLNPAEGGLVTVTKCWERNTLLLYGPSQKVQSVLTFIKTQIDVPHRSPSGRLGDNIISKD